LLPNLIVIGAAKCGTTSLHHYLGQHPEIFMASPDDPSYPRGKKEMRFFWRDDWRERLDWYESHFPGEANIEGEATPGYTQYPVLGHVPERMHTVVPDAKLIYLVRDPIDRAVSHWAELRAGGEERSLSECLAEIDDPRNVIVSASRYSTQIRQYLEYFPEEQLLVVDQADLRASRTETLRRIFSFLGVDPTFTSESFSAERNTRSEKRGIVGWRRRMWDGLLVPLGRLAPPGMRRAIKTPIQRTLSRAVDTPELDDSSRAKLAAALAPEVEELRTMTGEHFETWSV